VLAHATFGMAFVAVIVQARLAAFDRSLEEAALDLGARPWKVLLVITLPLIAPSLITGWLLAFTLSLDDLVIASFVSGPASTTLPMVIFSSVRLGVSRRSMPGDDLRRRRLVPGPDRILAHAAAQQGRRPGRAKNFAASPAGR